MPAHEKQHPGGHHAKTLKSPPELFFVALRAPWWITLFPFVSFFVALHGPLSSPTPSLRNFVALRGFLFGPSRPLADPSSWPFVDIFLPFPGNPFSPARPLAEPSRAFSNPFVALRRSSWPFVDFFLPFPGNPFPFPTFGRALSSLLQPLRGPSPFFVALRGFLFAFSWKSFPLPDLWRIPLEPSPTPSWPFAVLRGPSWISFCLFLEILSPLPDPWQSPLEPSPTP